MNGYDFSAFQGMPNWNLIQADFVFLRASDGVNITANGLANSMDISFISNAEGADNRKIRRGAYHVYTADSIQAQFNRFSTVPKATDGMIALDVEPTVMNSLTPLKVLQDIRQWESTVLSNTHKPSLVYMNVSTYRWLGSPSIQYLWLADPSQVDNSIPRTVTQRTTAIINGVVGEVDTDTWEGTLADFHILLGDTMSSITANKPPVAILVTPSNKGYYLIGSDGGVFTFGDAVFHGSAGNLNLAAPIITASLTPSGNGYYMVGADGGVFAFGDAQFQGRITVA